jgi:Flp pilus assembly pilin Flp
MRGVEMMGYLKRFLKEEQGPTAVEYAIMLALVALAIALATPGIRDAVIGIFNATADALNKMGA